MASVRRGSARAAPALRLRRKARRIKNARKRKAALRRLPKRCRAAVQADEAGGTLTTAARQPAARWSLRRSPRRPRVADAARPPPAAGRSAPSPDRRLRRRLRRPPGRAAAVARRASARGRARRPSSPRWASTAAVASLTRPAGAATLVGPEPTVDGEPLDPYGTWGHDHLWWIDRMVRSRPPARRADDARLPRLVRDLQRRRRLHASSCSSRPTCSARTGLGQLPRAGAGDHHRPGDARLARRASTTASGAINENYGRELMELFTLGADRGAYTETDVREIARALSGWRADWDDGVGLHDFRFDAAAGTTRAPRPCSARRARSTWEDACRLVVEHPLHAVVLRGASCGRYFIPTPPAADAGRRAGEALRRLGPRDPARARGDPARAGALRRAPRMVKPPIVFVAGHAARDGPVRSPATAGRGCATTPASSSSTRPTSPAGTTSRWLDTSTMAGRWDARQRARGRAAPARARPRAYPAETAAAGARRAPARSGATRDLTVRP